MRKDTRYSVAMVFAIVGGALAFAVFGTPVANWFVAEQWVVDTFAFEDPQDVGNIHSLAFMLVCLGGLLIGWLVGWVIAGPLAKGIERPEA